MFRIYFIQLLQRSSLLSELFTEQDRWGDGTIGSSIGAGNLSL